MSLDSIQIRRWQPELSSEMLAYLTERIHNAMFLLNNFRSLGGFQTDHPNSGNFKIIFKENSVKGVFCLTKRGNILTCMDQDVLSVDLIELCLDHIVTEPLPVVGILGDWSSLDMLTGALIYNSIWPDVGFVSKEQTYRLQLSCLDHTAKDSRIRFLGKDDFQAWSSLRELFIEELGIRDNLTDQQLRDSFAQLTEDKWHWGYFEGHQLVATTSLNAIYEEVAQIGNVFALPAHRGQGKASKLILTQLRDLSSTHNCQQVVLFTGTDNLAARSLYERVGFEPIGFYGMAFRK